MTDWETTAKQMFGNKIAVGKIVERVAKMRPDVPIEQVQADVIEVTGVRTNLLRTVSADKPVIVTPQKKVFVPLENQKPKEYVTNWDGTQRIKFGLMGDTQINSKYTQLTYLHQYYDECERQEVQKVYHTGDIDEGEHMRKGHEYELYNHGADEHVEEICRVYPRRNGIETLFITGNHDASIYKESGFDIGRAIAQNRNDMIYLGRDCAVVRLTPNCTLELRHPWDGTAYAYSYKPQKMVEAMEADSKPNILAIGHYHKAEYIFIRSVHVFQTGCFQMQTPFMRGKSIAAHMGGWIITVDVDENGYIKRIIPQFIPFYKPLPDDYKAWR